MKKDEEVAFEFKVWCISKRGPVIIHADDMFMEENAYNFYVADEWKESGLRLSDSFPYCNVLRVSINHREDKND